MTGSDDCFGPARAIIQSIGSNLVNTYVLYAFGCGFPNPKMAIPFSCRMDVLVSQSGDYSFCDRDERFCEVPPRWHSAIATFLLHVIHQSNVYICLFTQ
jgi:hypothetical protein